jgi:hypothetical protein
LESNDRPSLHLLAAGRAAHNLLGRPVHVLLFSRCGLLNFRGGELIGKGAIQMLALCGQSRPQARAEEAIVAHFDKALQ